MTMLINDFDNSDNNAEPQQSKNNSEDVFECNNDYSCASNVIDDKISLSIDNNDTVIDNIQQNEKT